MSGARAIRVRADWEAFDGPEVVGTLCGDHLRGEEALSFDYESSWLRRGVELALDPGLKLLSKRSAPGPKSAYFGVLLDSCPDEWGRSLIQRRAAREALRLGQVPRPLTELDYLLGVHDVHRTGALRFDQGRGQLDDHAECVSPPWKILPVLENASRSLETKGSERQPGSELWLRILIAPGASLGGSRPKACVTDWHGRSWIAKFPSVYDEIDVGAWEYVVRELGQRAGLQMAEARMEQLGSRHRTYLTRRFDRTDGGARRHMASAMTLLGKPDACMGAGGAAAASYLELAEFIQREGSRSARDLRELWTRMAFFVAVSNTDDHLRNHAFLLEVDGWCLSPAFDVNSNPNGTGLTLNISEDDNVLSFELLHEVAPSFRIKHQRAKKILRGIEDAVSTWRSVAAGISISPREMEVMERAFSLSARPEPVSSLGGRS